MLSEFKKLSGGHVFFLDTANRRTFVLWAAGCWWWLVTDAVTGDVLAGQRDWRLDAFEAADRAVDWLRTEASDRLHMEAEPR